MTGDEEHIKELKDKSENENTEQSTGRTFEWANERNFQANLEECRSNVLDQTVPQLYAFRN